MPSRGRAKAQQLADSAGLEALARVGFIAYGVVYLLVGWLALQLAWDTGPSKSPGRAAWRTRRSQESRG